MANAATSAASWAASGTFLMQLYRLFCYDKSTNFRVWNARISEFGMHERARRAVDLLLRNELPRELLIFHGNVSVWKFFADPVGSGPFKFKFVGPDWQCQGA